jgi:hypothetical protein
MRTHPPKAPKLTAVAAVVAFTLAVVVPAGAQAVRHVDDQGQIHYTDERARVARPVSRGPRGEPALSREDVGRARNALVALRPLRDLAKRGSEYMEFHNQLKPSGDAFQRAVKDLEDPTVRRPLLAAWQYYLKANLTWAAWLSGGYAKMLGFVEPWAPRDPCGRLKNTHFTPQTAGPRLVQVLFECAADNLLLAEEIIETTELARARR